MNSPAAEIQAEIARSGPITFARFMELALYAPGSGYYEFPREIGRRGDFFTSVSVGPVFGAMLACQFARWLESIPVSGSGRWQIVEAGAHNGQLAMDILRWLRRRKPETVTKLDYWIVEPSVCCRAIQQTSLRGWSNVKWAHAIGEIGEGRVHGIIFSNELLDAMPVNRLCWDASTKKWMEWGVDWKESEFVWHKMAASAAALGGLPGVAEELKTVLPDGYMVEASPAALQWWSGAAACLGSGKLLALDYGFGEGEWLRPESAAGTLRAYRGHHHAENLLREPGEQDITAHVNFPMIQLAGEAAGLKTEMFVRQSKFLMEILQLGLKERSGFQDWTPGEIRQFQTLSHPEHLGDRFRVLVQSRE